MTRGVIGLAWRLLGLATLASVLVAAAPASADASPGGSLTIATTGLPSSQRPSLVLGGPSLRRVITSQHVTLRGLRPGHYELTLRPVIVKHPSRSVRSGATALPAKRSVGVTVVAGRATRVVAAYGSVINPGVRSVPGGLLGVSGNADDPHALVLSGRSRPPGVGTILTSGPTALLPVGLISKVTRTAHQHGRLVVSLTSVPITDAVPELSFQGSLQLKPAHGAAQEAGSAVPAQAASVPRAHSASACGISASSSLLRFGAHLDSVELREALLGAWPPQLKLTLAVRTTETLGLGLLSVGLNCSWTLAEIGPFDEAIPVGPLLIPVYATLPLTVKLSLNGSVQAGSINVASTTVAHVAAGFDENAASLSEQGSNIWSTGPSVSGSASLAATIGVQAGIGIAKAGNLHVEAAFGPEFDASTGQGCNLHIDLGSLSAGTEVFGQSLNTPAFTPFKIPLWSGCKPTGGGGGSGGGSGGGGGGGSGGGGGGSGGGSGGGGGTEGGGGGKGKEGEEGEEGGKGGTWTKRVVPGSPLALTCPTTSFCAAAAEATGAEILTTTEPTGTSAAWTVTGPEATQISCGTPTLCVAPFGYFASPEPHFALLWSHEPTVTGEWNGGSLSPEWSMSHISCTSDGFCAATAGGGIVTSTNPLGGVATWHDAENVDPSGAFTGISCSSKEFCAAVDEKGNVFTATNPAGGAGAWSEAHVESASTGTRLTAVSCPSASFCAVADSGGRLFTTTHPTEGPGAWTAKEMEAPASSLSCASSTLCAMSTPSAILTSTNPSGSAAWGRVPLVGVTDLSCPTDLFCAAVLGNEVLTSTNPGG